MSESSAPDLIKRFRRHSYQEKAANQAVIKAMTWLKMQMPRTISAITKTPEPEWERIIRRVTEEKGAGHKDCVELEDTAIILTDEDGRYAVIEPAIIAAVPDIERARRRTDLLAAAVSRPVMAAVICAGQPEAAAAGRNIILIPMKESKHWTAPEGN